MTNCGHAERSSERDAGRIVDPDNARSRSTAAAGRDPHHEVGNIALLLDAALTLMNAGPSTHSDEVFALLHESRRRLDELLS